MTRLRALTVVLLVGTVSLAAAPRDVLTRARQLYNSQQYDKAIELAAEARRTPELTGGADLVSARAHLERYRQSGAADDLTAAREALARIQPGGLDDAAMPRCPKLQEDLVVDAVIVGGGITGLTTAYLLARAGRSVAVLERARLGRIDSGHTSAHLTMVTDSPLHDLAKSLSVDDAQAAWNAGLAAIASIAQIVAAEDIDCDFAWVPGYLCAALGGPAGVDARYFEDEATLGRELGFDVEFEAAVPFAGGPGVRFADQARFHPGKYLAGLARIILDSGGRIYERSAADEFSQSPRTVHANGHRIRCEDVIIATHDPRIGYADQSTASWLQTKLALYSTYVVGGRAPKGSVPDGLFWDRSDPYRYLRIEPGSSHDFVMLGGEDHKTGQASDTIVRYQRLERILSELVPKIELTHRWSGQVIETPDGLPLVGPTADHQYVATGFSGNGMTFGTLAATIMADAVTGRPNRWQALFDVRRSGLSAGAVWAYVKENVDYPSYKLRDHLVPAEARSLRNVRRDQGKILLRQGQKVAAYRDADGRVVMRSAYCSHMGCLVTWNPAEHTWDCPCHGSRFDPSGAVIAGPADSPLAEVKAAARRKG